VLEDKINWMPAGEKKLAELMVGSGAGLTDPSNTTGNIL
jgi:hypothetical protein